MKKVLLAAAAVACLGTVAMAGPNAGGTLIVVSNGTVFCADEGPFCGSYPDAACDVGTSIDGANLDAVVLNVMAAFASGAAPSVAGVTFGIAYNSAEVFLAGQAGCGDFELADASWPASGTGTAVTWNVAQTNQLNDVYWIAAYNYYGNPNMLELIPHPSQGANFADDGVPPALDPIAALGAFGFDGPGRVACPEDTVQGACCYADGSCELVREEDCQGVWDGSTSCDPNPCIQPSTAACCVDMVCSTRTADECDGLGGQYFPGEDCAPDFCVVPTVDSTWGEIKNTFR